MDTYWRWYHLANTFVVFVLAAGILVALIFNEDVRTFALELADVERAADEQDIVLQLLAILLSASAAYFTWLVMSSQPSFHAIAMLRNELTLIAHHFRTNRVSERIRNARKDLNTLDPKDLHEITIRHEQWSRLSQNYPVFYKLNRFISRSTARMLMKLEEVERLATEPEPDVERIAKNLIICEIWLILALHVAGRFQLWHCLELEQCLECVEEWGICSEDIEIMDGETMAEIRQRFDLRGAEALFSDC